MSKDNIPSIKEFRDYLLGERFSEIVYREDRDLIRRCFSALADIKSSIDDMLHAQPRLRALTGHLKAKYEALSTELEDEVKRVMAERGDKLRERSKEKGERATEKKIAELVMASPSVVEAKRKARLAEELAMQLLGLDKAAESRQYTLHELSQRDRNIDTTD